jgi:hypothetical protein
MTVSPWAARDEVFDAHCDVASDGVRNAAEPNPRFICPVV